MGMPRSPMPGISMVMVPSRANISTKVTASAGRKEILTVTDALPRPYPVMMRLAMRPI